MGRKCGIVRLIGQFLWLDLQGSFWGLVRLIGQFYRLDLQGSFWEKWVKTAMKDGRLTVKEGCSIGGRRSKPWGNRGKRAISRFLNSRPLLKNEQLVQFLQFRPLKNIIYNYLQRKTIFKNACNFVQFIAIFLKLKTPNCTILPQIARIAAQIVGHFWEITL